MVGGEQAVPPSEHTRHQWSPWAEVVGNAEEQVSESAVAQRVELAPSVEIVGLLLVSRTAPTREWIVVVDQLRLIPSPLIRRDHLREILDPVLHSLRPLFQGRRELLPCLLGNVLYRLLQVAPIFPHVVVIFFFAADRGLAVQMITVRKGAVHPISPACDESNMVSLSHRGEKSLRENRERVSDGGLGEEHHKCRRSGGRPDANRAGPAAEAAGSRCRRHFVLNTLR
mmetsp:Transcript_32500/g.59755  ORF Transcript_32500/g.59755 Transcript_32500/m.59755 type:complete len:227 (-) Transcript_32500:93-773(-)